MSEQKSDPINRTTLGRPIKIYSGQSVSVNDFFLWVLPGVMIPLAVLALGTYAGISGVRPAGMRPSEWYALAALSLVPFAILSFRRFTSARKAVLLYENGMRLRNISKHHPALLWCQIGSIRSAGTRYHFFGLPVSDSLSLVVEPVHSREVVIPNSIQEIEELAEKIKHEVYPLLYESMAEDLRQGQSLLFGDVAVESQHLRVRGKPYDWEEIGAFWVESGNLLFENGPAGRVKVPTQKINNLELLLKIVATHFSRA